MKFKLFVFCTSLIFSAYSNISFAKDRSDLFSSQNNSEYISSIYSKDQMKNSFSSCSNLFPSGKVFKYNQYISTMKPFELCSDNFAVLYSKRSKTPVVVVEKLNKLILQDAKGEQRTDNFFEDNRVPFEFRSQLSDYHDVDIHGFHYDRGHNAPAADAPNFRAMQQTFSLTNMIPQNSINNRKIWSKIESDVRKFVLRTDGDVYVYTGPIYDETDLPNTLGRNKVWIPEYIFKLVYDESNKRAWAYILPNAETKITQPVNYEDFLIRAKLPLLDGIQLKGSIK